MTKIKWESVKIDNIGYLGLLNGYKNDKVIYQIYTKHLDDGIYFVLTHYSFENNIFNNFKIIKKDIVKKSEKSIIDDTILIVKKLEEYQKFVNFFERRKKISKLVAEF